MTTAYDLAGNQLIKAYRAADTSGENALSSANSLLQFRPVSLRFLSLFTEEEKRLTYDTDYGWITNVWQKRHFCGMRSAEFKLIEAECYYHLGKKDKALQSINELRSHRIDNYSNLTENNLPTLSEKEIITIDANGNALTPLMGLILNERRKELFLEGDRFFELKRNETPNSGLLTTDKNIQHRNLCIHSHSCTRHVTSGRIGTKRRIYRNKLLI